MTATKTSMPAKSSRMTQAQEERIVSDMIRDSISDLMKARLILAEGGWRNTTDLLTAMTLTRFGHRRASSAGQWMWKFAKERGATKKDLLQVRSTPELQELLPNDPAKKAKRGKARTSRGVA